MKMKRALWGVVAIALSAGIACEDGSGTTGPPEKALEFTTVLLQKPEDTIARINEEAARDPLYRVTISEAGQAAVLSVSKTVQVDVLDFP
jgi:hypothetical protein